MSMEAPGGGFGSSASCTVDSSQSLDSSFVAAGRYQVVCENEKGEVVWTEDIPNGVTQSGMQYIIQCAFYSTAPSTAGTAQITDWYIGLINNSGTPTLAAADTAGSHSGWSELTASGNISDSTRPRWTTTTGGGPSTYTVTTNGTSTSDYNFINTASIYGVFLSSIPTLNTNTGTLASTAAFGSPQAVANGYKIKISYTMNGTLT